MMPFSLLYCSVSLHALMSGLVEEKGLLGKHAKVAPLSLLFFFDPQKKKRLTLLHDIDIGFWHEQNIGSLHVISRVPSQGQLSPSLLLSPR